MTSQALVTIVIGTFNRARLLRGTIESIRAHVKVDYRIEVSDAGSTDDTAGYLQSAAGPDLHVTFEGRKRGQAVALNEIFAMVETPYVCWLSDDNVLIGNGLDIALKALEADPTLGMVGLKVRDLEGPFVAHPYIGGISPVGILNINQGVLPTALLKKLGGFSEVFGNYGIDPDLTTQVLVSGASVAMTRAVALHHHRGWDQYAPDDPAHPLAQSARFLDLYRRKYLRHFGNSRVWWARRALWWLARRLMPEKLSLVSHRPVFGLLARDWHNMFSGRFISPLREFRMREADIHLRQTCPRRFHSAKPLPDPGP